MKYTQEQLEAMSSGAHMANATHKWAGSLTVHSYVITDNPYDRKSRKKQHVTWHNAFYESRKNSNYKRLI